MMLTVIEWCRSRSRTAVAITGSPKTSADRRDEGPFPRRLTEHPPSRIDEGGLPSAAVRSTADHGVALRPNLTEEGSPMEAYVGLDVHSKRSVFVIEAEDGRVVARGDIPTTPEGFRRLRRQHQLPPEAPVALETGTVAFYAARELARVGLRP